MHTRSWVQTKAQRAGLLPESWVDFTCAHVQWTRYPDITTFMALLVIQACITWFDPLCTSIASHLVEGVLLVSGGWRRGVRRVSRVSLRLNKPGQVILDRIVLGRGVKAADVRHAACGWRGDGLAALWLAAAGPRMMSAGVAAGVK